MSESGVLQLRPDFLRLKGGEQRMKEIVLQHGRFARRRNNRPGRAPRPAVRPAQIHHEHWRARPGPAPDAMPQHQGVGQVMQQAVADDGVVAVAGQLRIGQHTRHQMHAVPQAGMAGVAEIGRGQHGG